MLSFDTYQNTVCKVMKTLVCNNSGLGEKEKFRKKLERNSFLQNFGQVE